MSESDLPESFIQFLRSVKAKRPRTVINHILEHGQVTTEELKELYGYNHPPRAVRDVREQGIPVVTFRVTGTDGRKIAAYKFGDPSKMRAAKLSGRTAFTLKLKSALIDKYSSRCNIYLEEFLDRELQIDHRIPFEIARDKQLSEEPDDYMLLCPSANRAKSWSCENCKNWRDKNPNICKSCYWAFPENYSHIAMRDIRRLDLIWTDGETKDYDLLKHEAEKVDTELPKYVKEVLQTHFRKKNGNQTTNL